MSTITVYNVHAYYSVSVIKKCGDPPKCISLSCHNVILLDVLMTTWPRVSNLGVVSVSVLQLELGYFIICFIT